MEPVIEVKKIGKKYRLTHQQGGYIALRDVLTNVMKHPFAFLKTKAKNAAGLGKKEDFWALRDISFSMARGEVIGIIGRNGAGKSTLLKILTGITPPTEGEVVMRGRVASLLEVGTGFHPELTGRENIFLNGAIIGMTKKEIVRKFDQIVEFAGITKFLDTPVKRYSSGMYVRLAFSVAAHMEPDILLVDEVLAVGDAEFQKKCLGKMEEVTEKSGRTIIFVSHNMAAIQRLCKKTIWIKDGKIAMFDRTDKVVEAYLNVDSSSPAVYEKPARTDKDTKMQIRKVTLLDHEGKETSQFKVTEPWSVKIDYDIHEEVSSIHVGLYCKDQNGSLLFVSSDGLAHPSLAELRKAGSYQSIFTFPKPDHIFLSKTIYFLEVTLEVPNVVHYDTVSDIRIDFTRGVERPETEKPIDLQTSLLVDGTWKTSTLMK